MTERIRCTACRGSKEVAKLGGIMGECNACEGKGTILLADKPVIVEPEIVEPVAELIAAVSECLPVAVEPEVVKPIAPRKRPLIKRKSA